MGWLIESFLCVTPGVGEVPKVSPSSLSDSRSGTGPGVEGGTVVTAGRARTQTVLLKPQCPHWSAGAM